MKRILPVVFFIISFNSFSQTGPTPAQTLRLARATYEQGRLHEIPTQLNDAIISKMSQKQDKVEAYKILCLTYIYLEEPEKADESMLNILRTDPYFEINEAVDPAEFVALYKTFRTTPIYRIGARLGVNATQPNVSSVQQTTFSKSEYKFLVGLQFGAAIDIPITKKITVNSELSYQQKRFELTSDVNRFDPVTNSNFKSTLTAVESQNWISVPILVQYRIMENKINPYIGLGISTDFLLGSKIVADRQRKNETPVDEKSIEVKPQREKLNLSAVVSAGVKIPVAGGFFVTEIKYLYGIKNVNSDETSYKNISLYTDYGFPNAIYKLNSVSITVAYIQNIFNPKKLHKKR